MTQVLATTDFEVEHRKYIKGLVITFNDEALVPWLKARGFIDTSAVSVAAAITAGAKQVTHSPGGVVDVGGSRNIFLPARIQEMVGPGVRLTVGADGRARLSADARLLVPMPPAAHDTVLWVAGVGSDANNGLTEATAVASIWKAYEIGNALGVPYTVNVRGPLKLDRSKTFTNGGGAVVIPSQPCIVQAIGGPVVTHTGGGAAPLVWTLEAGTTWKTARSNANRVVDWQNEIITETDGGPRKDFAQLTLAASLAACQETPGSWFTDNATVYVNRIDGAQVSNVNTAVLLHSVDAFEMTTNGNMWIIGFQQLGGTQGGLRARNNPKGRLLTVDCKFPATTNAAGVDAVQSLDIDLFVGLRTGVCFAGKDGFNFHTANGSSPRAVLIDCYGYEVGTVAAQNSCNAVTMHDGGVLLDLNGDWGASHGGCVAHVNPGTLAMHVRSRAVKSYGDLGRGGVTPAGTGFLSGDFAEVMLVACVGSAIETGGGIVRRIAVA